MGSSISIEKLRKIAEENSGINIDDLINKIQYIKHGNLTKFEEK